ncbi:MAG: bifunctional homocysteine S-methyltransferase/methylenetetrahydrofolate reductase [Thermomicrobiales bacterium]
MAHPLLDLLSAGVVLADGAMGTMLYEAGRPPDDCLDATNLSHPEIVARIHLDYLNAGANIIETNTFGANRFRLEAHGLIDKVQEINARGVRIAREAREISGSSALVAGSVGPTGRTLEPFGTLSRQEAYDAFREQIECLLERGVDLLTIETMGNLDEMDAAIAASQDVGDLPIVAMMTFAEDGRTLTGNTPADVVARLASLRVAAIGANCSVGPQRLLGSVRAMRAAADRLDGHRPAIAAMPNAGWPTRIGDRLIYRSSPEYFAEFARRAVEAGAEIVGGCCGTTPAHIAAMREALDARQPSPEEPRETALVRTATPVVAAVPAPPTLVALADGPTGMQAKLGKKFLRCVEIDPPKGLNPQKAIDGARMLKDAGVDAINVADSPMARVRMSAMTLCYLIQHEVGVETILHYTTRDRSLMGLQSELLGAHAAGVRNILALTGDPPSLGEYPNSSAVYDVDSVGLIRIIDQMKKGADSAGASIGREASFTIACAVDPTKPDLEDEARRLKAKIAAGADFVMTQPIFDKQVWLNFLEVYGAERLPVPVMIGILPLQSTKHAEFLHNEVPGITLTDAARERMRKAGSDGRREGVLMAQELLTDLKPLAQGVYLMPSFGRYEVAAEVIGILDDEEPAEATA